jgi:CRP/FNR family cyclic AMP-dependent transcriptional regulator
VHISRDAEEAEVGGLSPSVTGQGACSGWRPPFGIQSGMTSPPPKERLLPTTRGEFPFSFRRPSIAHMLACNIRIEEDLIDQLFNSSEKRLARTLLPLARYGKQDRPARVVPKVSQETLAEMIGTTRARVNFFLNQFKKLGFIEYNGELALKINRSLLSVVLHD